jgi:hypothetical protein
MPAYDSGQNKVKIQGRECWASPRLCKDIKSPAPRLPASSLVLFEFLDSHFNTPGRLCSWRYAVYLMHDPLTLSDGSAVITAAGSLTNSHCPTDAPVGSPFRKLPPTAARPPQPVCNGECRPR